ncbi:hypothetical protein STAQ_19840 [Allostella sp. ATCC 35155]|nr:hypothetical protein STAQ_19840 [Stella sp. ATCC 35155]
MAKPFGRLRICDAQTAAPRERHPDLGTLPEFDTLDHLLRACRALARDPGLRHASEAHQRIVRRARGTRTADTARRTDP